ncbi:MAG: glycyl-radical enzyme activating protein [Candidatus Mariimomonas ferrooxydans]
MTDRTAQVFEIVRGTTHDGPGMRTTVFLKGCSLNCSWCQNPEGISRKLEISWEAGKCIHCLECIKACKKGALFEETRGIVRDKSKCILCGDCVEACPSHAMEFTARKWTMDSLIKEVLKDYDYYDSFGGGVTVSGGEPLIQNEFIIPFFKKLKEHGVHTALDTCGLVPKEILIKALKYTDLVLFDLKFIDETLHKKYTDHSNKLILKNLIAVTEEIRKLRNKKTQSGKELKLWIRTPLIPGATATPENLTAIASFIQENISDIVERWELCTFNRACISKYDKLDLKWEFENTPTMKQKDVDSLKKSALSAGFDKEKLIVTGLTKK